MTDPYWSQMRYDDFESDECAISIKQFPDRPWTVELVYDYAHLTADQAEVLAAELARAAKRLRELNAAETD